MQRYFSSESSGSVGYQAYIDYRALEKVRESRLHIIDQLISASDPREVALKESYLRVAEAVMAKIEVKIEKKKSKKSGYYEAYAQISNFVDDLIDAIYDEAAPGILSDEKGAVEYAAAVRKKILDELTVDMIMR